MNCDQQIDTIMISDSDDDTKVPSAMETGSSMPSILAKSSVGHSLTFIHCQGTADSLQYGPASSRSSSPRPEKLAETPPLAGLDTDRADNEMQPALSRFRWIHLSSHPTVLYGRNFQPHVLEQPARVAAFDLDGTLIKTKSGNTFPDNEHDWKLWSDRVKQKLSVLSKAGAKNYKGKRREWIRIKVVNICAALQGPLRALAALEKDKFRKPDVGMWKLLSTNIEEEAGVKVDKAASFFVGDAAGRSGDHSRGDIDMAEDVGLIFYTPEEFFNGAREICVSVQLRRNGSY
ncbi:DNA kinase/phosphatase Pnk1 [Microbotryomycetes sp. JL201]|nr:DNA kinase/phosphatase Pnk1 [Microbotryomycetes sp. JL201]